MPDVCLLSMEGLVAIRGSRNGVFYISCLPPARVTVAHVPMVCGRLCQPLPAVPTLWARPRAVIELGGERLPHRSPLGGRRAGYEGARQRQGLELGKTRLHSHDLTASLLPSDRSAGTFSRTHPPPPI